MKKHVLMPLFALLLTLAFHGAAYAEEIYYHPPLTPAEHALSKLFDIAAKEKGFLSATLNNFAPNYDPIKARQYTPLFTPALVAKYRAESLKLYRECAGRIRLCFEPPVLSCSMNSPEIVSFRTLSENGRIAIVAYSLHGKKDGAQYKMVNQNGKWKLDDFSCLISPR
jgi:hypothetical protein